VNERCHSHVGACILYSELVGPDLECEVAVEGGESGIIQVLVEKGV